jgi:DNA modification methylase
MQSIKLSDIVVGDRLRKDYGNLDDLDTIATIGLIQPIVLVRDSNGQHTLVAGGRRLTKLQELGYAEVYHGVTCEPERPGFIYRDELPADIQRECELYENICRKQMAWQERVLAIFEIHYLKKKRAALDREEWGQRETGAEVGLTYASISYSLAIAEELKKPDSPIKDCKGFTDALRFLLGKREDEAKRELAELTSKTLPHVDLKNLNAPEITQETLEGQGPTVVVPLSKMLFHGDMVPLCKDFGFEAVDHIITDWPYAIDMDYLDQGQGMDVSRVRTEHNAVDNLRNYGKWIEAMYYVLKPKGFCVVWYDNIHFAFIRNLAEEVGFRVQRWPLVWVKTSPCLNQMASKNWTKATEFAMVLSKQNATLIKPQSVNYWSGPRAATISNPFAKPKGLWQWILAAFALPGDVILDPFAGEMSAPLAIIDFGCRPVAFESNADHYNQGVINVRELYTNLTKGNVQFA